ncbi:MAG: ABC transporter ATP-binding protein [Thermodesulfovibrio sp.]|nr:ABC transporter ATP-binding protein [Thermodesulfovibrio sp.]MDW7999280.1 ABC transporter ATP-binding protein [Thermodesulfovibrio sp.]
MIEIKNIKKIYKRGAEKLYALKGIDCSIEKGEFIAITGPSGSGKSTFLHIIGCLDSPTEGEVIIDGINIKNSKKKDLINIRRQKIGFVFQNFYLIPGLNIYENIALPVLFSRKKNYRKKILSLIEDLGLSHRINHKPHQLSGGEMQRVAIARALANEPEILLADEPTGSLDTENSERIFEIFRTLNNKGLTIIVATHNLDLAKKAPKVFKFKDGLLVK